MNKFKQSIINGAMRWKDICVTSGIKAQDKAMEDFMEFIDFLKENPTEYNADSISLCGKDISDLEYDYENKKLTVYTAKDSIKYTFGIEASDWIDIQNYVVMYLRFIYDEEDDADGEEEYEEHIEVDSTWIKSFTYDKKSKVLTMDTLNDNTYTYKVSPELWNDLKECHKGGDSIGQFYNDYIKI